MPASISVVIPTLNAAHLLPPTCDALLAGVTDGLISELILSDGGSEDAIAEVADALGARLIVGSKGRGAQIARGVEKASAPWVLILHADTHLSEGWADAVRHHMSEYPEAAGWFRLRFRASGLAPCLVAGGANLRARLLALPYGDQGLLIQKTTLAAVGGFPDLPLMEDVAMARRLQGRLRALDAQALTSADRYLADGWARRSLSNLGTLLRFFLGTKPETLVQRYESKSR